jgi:hypothetical protein
MDNNSLRLKWDNILQFKERKGYKALRLSSNCKADLFIATDIEGYRCLLLYLPSGTNIIVKGVNKDKLLLSYIDEKDILMIKLKDSDFVDLFDDLILSLYSKIVLFHEPDKASQELINSFFKWADFFEDSYNHKLSAEQIMGLFGELFYLNILLSDAIPSNVNSILESWKGPYDTANDFVLDAKNIEVKTKIESKPYVKISSEFQLEKEFDKGLNLLIVTIKTDLVKGESIYKLILKIVNRVRSNSGDLSVFYKAIGQKGLKVESSKEYNNHKFIVISTRFYDCTKIGFPKLSRSDLCDEISALSYKLRVTTLAKFLIEEKKY